MRITRRNSTIAGGVIALALIVVLSAITIVRAIPLTPKEQWEQARALSVELCTAPPENRAHFKEEYLDAVKQYNQIDEAERRSAGIPVTVPPPSCLSSQQVANH